jgi:replicative DNA helicase
MIIKGMRLSAYAENFEFETARKLANEIILLNENVDDKPFSDTFNSEDFERLSKSKRFFSNDLHTLTFYLPFMRGENIYIAGKTSTGKTQLALNLALSFLDRGASVGYVSMELGREQLLIRLLNWEMGNEQVRLSDIDIRQKEWWDLGMALIKQDKFKNFYFTEEFNRLDDIISWIEIHKFDVVFIDYIQLMKSGTGRNRVEELGDIAKEFRRLSKKRCMVILSQFNRQKDEDEDEIDLSRIRDSGEIEQTATGVILIRRDKKEASQFYYAIAKNQTYGSLSLWKRIDLNFNGAFKEVND